nr:AAA family ATPase [uncultured Azospirillum sp.]
MDKPITADDWFALSFELTSLFSGAPIAEEELFAGRASEVRRILEAVLDRSRHVLLYGERGVGKTSISNVFWRRYNKTLQTVIAARVQADPSDDFTSLWLKALEEIQTTAHHIGKSELIDVKSDYDHLTPDIIRRELSCTKPNAIPIIIIDEFDKLTDLNARELTANVIKSLHDYSINATIVIVGVSEDVSSLISDHASIRRALAQIKLERMSRLELNEIIDKRLKLTPMKISNDARWMIVTLSRGLPYFTQMLGKFSAQSAASNQRILIDVDDVDAAMERFIEEEDQSFQDNYRAATESNQAENFFSQVLLACALARTDDSGFFTPTDVIEPLNAILSKKKRHAHFQRHLTEFISDKRGNVLIRRGTERQYRYRFRDPMMQPYVIIKGIRSGMIGKESKYFLIQPDQPLLPIIPS